METKLFVSGIYINFFNNGRNAEQCIIDVMNTRVFERIKRGNITSHYYYHHHHLFYQLYAGHLQLFTETMLLGYII